MQDYTENVNGDVPLMVSGKLPQRKIVPWIIAPWMIAPRIIATRTIASVDNCPLGKLPPKNIVPRIKLHTIYFFAQESETVGL